MNNINIEPQRTKKLPPLRKELYWSLLLTFLFVATFLVVSAIVSIFLSNPEALVSLVLGVLFSGATLAVFFYQKQIDKDKEIVDTVSIQLREDQAIEEVRYKLELGDNLTHFIAHSERFKREQKDCGFKPYPSSNFAYDYGLDYWGEHAILMMVVEDWLYPERAASPFLKGTISRAYDNMIFLMKNSRRENPAKISDTFEENNLAALKMLIDMMEVNDK